MIGRRFLGWLPMAAAICGVFAAAPSCPAQTVSPVKPDRPKTAAAPPGDVFAVPSGGTKELLAFIDRLRQTESGAKNQEEYLAFVKKSAVAMIAAADKLMAVKDLDEESRVKGVSCQLQALSLLAKLDDAAAKQRIKSLALAAKGDKNKQLAGLARMQLIQGMLSDAEAGDPSQVPALLAELKSMLAESPADANLVRSGVSAATALERLGEYGAALDVFPALKAAAARSEQPQLAEAVEELSATTVKRLGAVGKPLAISGTTVDGKPFELAAYKGKVVLVDFWATWCGPCRAELPNVKANYDKYHDKGFEVVGISLDEDRQELERFLKEEKLPWVTLFSDDPKVTGALADKYGISGIPALMLVGRDGNVTTLKARGGDLSKQLERLLGPEKTN